MPYGGVAAIFAATVLSGCAMAGTGERVPLVAGTDAPVIIPGGPGDAGRTATPGERLGESEARVTAADVRFAENMVPHHRQALEMAALVPSRSSSQELRRLAERITAAQRPEITAMTSWLRSVGRVPRGHDDHTVPPDRMNRLRAARGAAFDDLFLNLMITHHEAAVEMAARQLREGADRVMLATAEDVVSGQGVEIARMRELLATWASRRS
ncbi:lipoprotein [Streptosporangium carneum]|uniref:Lipoprotein n=1 Tax=Streptosporangium carneum TaxID=47481 RepID=A0A9W6MGT1_9ACTN|nr:lipoprotein [Streptosporangium carneum]